MKKNGLTEPLLNKLRRYSLEETSECVCWINEKAELVYANAAACRQLGYSAEELYAMKIGDIVPAFSRDKGKKIFKDPPKQFPRTVEVKCISKDGDIINAEIKIVCYRIEGLNIACLFARDISEKVRAEAVLGCRIKLENIVSGMSSKFIKCAPDEIDNEINISLEKLGQSGVCDRVYIFLIRPDGLLMDNTHEWCAKGVSPQINNLQNCRLADFPWWMQKLKRLETIKIDDVEKMPAEASAENEILKAQNIKSLTVVPLVSGAYLHGFMGFDSVKEKKDWHGSLIKLLKISGEIIINAMERKRAEIVIQHKIDDLQKVADMAVKMELEIFSLKSKLKKMAH